MSDKKPTIKSLQAEIEQLKKSLQQTESNYKIYSGLASERSKTIDEMHAILDALPGSPGRQIEGKPYSENSITVRLVGWLACRLEGK